MEEYKFSALIVVRLKIKKVTSDPMIVGIELQPVGIQPETGISLVKIIIVTFVLGNIYYVLFIL